MSKKKKTALYNGLLLIDKPTGLSSHDVVRNVRKTLHMSAVGHCGTLDPMASGLMILLLGDATKLSQYILEQNKAYELELEFGYVTDTLDATGEVLSTEECRLESEQILALADQLQGDLELSVPAYSAVKVDGQRLYKSARNGDAPETPVRTMRFFELKALPALNAQSPSKFRFSIHCSKGSYIRSWVDRLGQVAGCGATLTALRRVASYPFELDQAVGLEQLSEQVESLLDSDCYRPMTQALPHLKAVHVEGQCEKLLTNGQISHKLRSELITRYQPGQSDKAIKVLSLVSGQMLALIGLEKQKGFVIRRVFNH